MADRRERSRSPAFRRPAESPSAPPNSPEAGGPAPSPPGRPNNERSSVEAGPLQEMDIEEANEDGSFPGMQEAMAQSLESATEEGARVEAASQESFPGMQEAIDGSLETYELERLASEQEGSGGDNENRTISLPLADSESQVSNISIASSSEGDRGLRGPSEASAGATIAPTGQSGSSSERARRGPIDLRDFHRVVRDEDDVVHSLTGVLPGGVPPDLSPGEEAEGKFEVLCGKVVEKGFLRNVYTPQYYSLLDPFDDLNPGKKLKLCKTCKDMLRSRMTEMDWSFLVIVFLNGDDEAE